MDNLDILIRRGNAYVADFHAAKKTGRQTTAHIDTIHEWFASARKTLEAIDYSYSNKFPKIDPNIASNKDTEINEAIQKITILLESSQSKLDKKSIPVEQSSSKQDPVSRFLSLPHWAGIGVIVAIIFGLIALSKQNDKPSEPNLGTEGERNVQGVNYFQSDCDEKIFQLGSSLSSLNEIAHGQTHSSIVKQGGNLNMGFTLKPNDEKVGFSCINLYLCKPSTPNSCDYIYQRFFPMADGQNRFSIKLQDSWEPGQYRISAKFFTAPNLQSFLPDNDQNYAVSNLKKYGEEFDFEITPLQSNDKKILVLPDNLPSRSEPRSSAGTQENKVEKSVTLGVNSFLWHASLETLNFMPLTQVDPFGGVIITDWYASPEAPNERFKANVYILDINLRADALKVTIFKQILSGDKWIDGDTDADTARQIENMILTRARDLYVTTIDK